MDLNIIEESAYLSVDVELLEESTYNGELKIKFKAKLQEANVSNNNKRRYPTETLQEIVNQLAPKATERKLLGELDHPAPQSNDLATRMKRSSTISIQSACVLFTKLEFDGRFIVAECETLTNDHGINLYRLLKDKVSIGFSLRAFGSSTKLPGGEVLVNAQGLKALTFDVVSNPSHSNAVIYEIITESTNIMQAASALKESTTDNVEIFFESDGTGYNQFNTDGEQVCACSIDGSCVQGTIQESIDFLLDQSIEQNNLKRFNFSL